MSYVCVPLYETLGENAIEFILQHAEVSLVFVEGSRMARMVQALKEVQPLLAVVYWGPASTADIKVGRQKGVVLQVPLVSPEDCSTLLRV